MRGINDAYDAFLLTYLHHCLPRHVDTGVADNAIQDADNFRRRIVLISERTRQGAKMVAEVGQNICVRFWERKFNDGNVYFRIGIVYVLYGLGNAAIRSSDFSDEM